MAALPVGARLGPYEVLAPLGAGGMGVVYRARDTRLLRTVAIKLLNAELSGDAVSRERFEREARSIAALTHPHICTLHDVGDFEGTAFLVMELLEGQTLARRLARTNGGLPLDEALSIATQVAEAFAFAHRHQIIHRDIKPANIMLTPTGVKLLDFGLARWRDRDEVTGQSRTRTTLTEPHGAMGTLAYMSPEQLEGRADERSDVFAFGAVLFEMLTGRKAFNEATSSTVIAAIVHSDPPAVSSLRPEASPSLDRVARRCLAKHPDARWQSAADLADELRWIADDSMPRRKSIESPVTRLRVLSALAATLSVALVAALLAWAPWRPAAEPPLPPETRLEIVTPATNDPTSFALSPDGRQIVFVASGDASSRLWLRSLAATSAQPMAGTEGGLYPFWSPDSRAVGFFAGNALKRVDLGGGAPQTLAPAVAGRGGTWNADGVILFASSQTGPVLRVPATGGAAVAVTRLAPQMVSHRWPQILPGGHQFLFYAAGTAETKGIYLGALDGKTPIRLTLADSAGVFLPERPRPAVMFQEGRADSTAAFSEGGWLLWVRSGTLVAQRLDLAKAALTGEPTTLADGVAVDDGQSLGAVSVAATGLIAYRTSVANRRQLAWFDRSGTARGTVGDPDSNNLTSPRVSHDGHRVLVGRGMQGNADVWMLDGARSIRVTYDAAIESFPFWSPDGTRIAFRSNRTGQGDLYQKLTNDAAVEQRVVASDQSKVPTSWSPDGHFLLYHSLDPQTSSDLWFVSMAGDHTPSVFLKTPFAERWGAFSPDGRWVAYQSDESGRPDIYARRFVPPATADAALRLHPGQSSGAIGGQWKVSTAGGVFPSWRSDGKELYYLNPAGAMMAAPIAVSGSSLEPSAPVTLFPTRIVNGGVDNPSGRQYDVTRDGRFLINVVLEDAAAPITLVMNWRSPTP